MPSKPWSKKKPARSVPEILLSVTGITVSPALTELDLATDPGAFVLKYTNSAGTPVQLSFRSQDFTSLEEGWRVKFLDPGDPATYRYSLSSWLQFSPPSLLLQPGQSGSLQVSVRSDSLSAGGHYGTVTADISTAPPPDAATVEIKSQLVSLVFVRASTGHERDAGKIAGFSSPHRQLISLPDSYLLRFDNYGNTHLVPRGLLVVRDFLGREVSRGVINLDSLPTLPETIRRYDIPLTVNLITRPLPGPYQASLTVTYASGQSLSSHFQFFSLAGPANLLVILLTPIVLSVLFRILLQKMKRR